MILKALGLERSRLPIVLIKVNYSNCKSFKTGKLAYKPNERPDTKLSPASHKLLGASTGKP